MAQTLKRGLIHVRFSGIQISHEISTALPEIDLKVFEKNPGLGGTWFENRYPGCTCDVPSHTYQFSWAPNPRWTQLYPGASEIRHYLENTVKDHNLAKFFNFNWRCVSAKWDESESKWTARFEHTQRNTNLVVDSDVLIYAVGRLNNYKIPAIDGQSLFKGRIVHTAAWPDDLDVSCKRIVIVGNGASAVQCVPALQPDTPEEISSFELDVQSYDLHRVYLEKRVAVGLSGLWRGTLAQESFQNLCRCFMQSNIQDPILLEALLPNFEAGCRRFTPGRHYLNALQQPNVEYLQDSVVELTEETLITGSGRRFDCDVIIYATGFEPYKPRFPVLGRDGVDLMGNWNREGPCESYMAAMVAQFPNFFVFCPPICPVNGPAIPGIERTSNYMTRVIHRLQTDSLKSVSVKATAQREFNEWAQSRMPEMVWSGQCSSWYKNENGKVTVPWPGTMLHYYRATQTIRWEDFELRHFSPSLRYDSFGNGLTVEGFVPEEFPWVKLSDREESLNKANRKISSVVQHLKAAWPCWSIWTLCAILKYVS
ncbi:unnamed protein product [Penicillium egyptiacum]|uniref:Monooxygenase n=1 Tax=Penicillium egyptiacum TaxID=1303716 RepID=A0A9W4P7U8_9EURO|nr:unnamed protein product [Penicillium egyptiacum]